MEAQIKTVMAVTDALFNPKPRKLSTDELIQAILVSASRLKREIEELAAKELQMPKDANLEEALDFVDGIQLDIEGYRRELNKPYEPHEPKCQCDACVAARSDEHYDRKRDGELMRDFNLYP